MTLNDLISILNLVLSTLPESPPGQLSLKIQIQCAVLYHPANTGSDPWLIRRLHAGGDPELLEVTLGVDGESEAPEALVEFLKERYPDELARVLSPGAIPRGSH